MPVDRLLLEGLDGAQQLHVQEEGELLQEVRHRDGSHDGRSAHRSCHCGHTCSYKLSVKLTDSLTKQYVTECHT